MFAAGLFAAPFRILRSTGIVGGDTGSGAAVFAFAVRIGSAVLLLASQIVLARWMGEFEYGIYVLVWIWVQLIGTATELGFGTSVLRFVPELRVTGKIAELRGVLLASRALAFGTSTVVALAGAGIVLVLGDAIESYYVVPLLLGLICVPMFALTDVQDGIARSHDWMGLALLPPFVWRPLLLLGFMLGALVFGAPPNAATAVLSAIGATWLAAIGQMVVLQRKLAGTVDDVPPKFIVPHWLRISLPMLLAEGFHVMMINTDMIVLGVFVTPDEAGNYFAAAKLLALVSMVFFAVTVAAGHRYAALFASGDRELLAAMVKRATGWAFWPSLAAAALTAALGYPALALFGPGFTSAYPVVFLLGVGLLVRAAFGPADRLLNVVGEQDICARIYLASLAANVILNLALVPAYGIFGAATATTLALCFESVLLGRAVRRRIGVDAFILARSR